MSSWAFLKDGPAVLPASDMADSLRRTDLSSVEVLVRESVQNSLDERRDDIDQPVRIRFERRVLVGSDKQRFIETLGLSELATRQKYFRAAPNWFPSDNEDLLRMSDPDTGLPILVISDFNTRGLGGRWNRRGSRNDRFFNLVFGIGGSQKQNGEDETARSLGSYGYGKMVFAMCSNIRTVLYYSTFRPDEGTGNDNCRAMATAFLPPHSKNDVDYAGQAYFGNISDDQQIPRCPLVDDDAHKWIRALGLPQRSQDETGTSVVIPATSAEIHEIVQCCERWWWPRMRDADPIGRVRFEFVDEGIEVPGCNPRSRSELSPFLDCYKLIKSSHAGDGYAIKDINVHAGEQRRRAGRLVLKALGAVGDTHESGDSFVNCVALIRDGLVIKYEHAFAHEDKAPVIGIFLPDENPETFQAFLLSEPPSHDEWVQNSNRMEVRYEWGPELLRRTKNRLTNLTRDFQTSQAPAPDTERTSASAFLKKSLRQIFRPPTTAPGPPVPPPPRTRAFTITKVQSGRRLSESDHQEDFAVFRISLSHHAAVNSAMVNVTFSLRALADADGKPTDSIPCEIHTPEGLFRGENGVTVRMGLEKDEKIDLQARGRVHPSWKTQWEVSVDRDQG